MILYSECKNKNKLGVIKSVIYFKMKIITYLITFFKTTNYIKLKSICMLYWYVNYFILHESESMETIINTQHNKQIKVKFCKII